MLLVSAVSSVIIGRKEHSDRQLPAENSQGSMFGRGSNISRRSNVNLVDITENRNSNIEAILVGQ